MRVKITIGMAVITLGLSGLCAVAYLSEDRKSPVITVPEEMITYTQGEDTSVLLQGVTAMDDIDGDITGKVRISNIDVIGDESKAVVTYAVYDKENNIGKTNRTVNYVAVVEKPEETENDGEASVQEEALTKAATSEATVDSLDEPLPEGYDDPELDDSGKPVIRLITHEVHLTAGSYFDSMLFVETAEDDKDDINSLYAAIYIEGDYNTNIPGEYELTYYCVDSDGNESNLAKLMLIIE